MSSAVVVFSLNAFAAFRLKSLICRLTIRHPAPLAARATPPLQGRVINRYALGIRRLCAHLTRKLSLAIHHRVRFNHIRHHLWTPTPDPSPQRGGEQSAHRFAQVASLLCEPSHSGAVVVRLQVQKNTFLVSGAVNCIGENPVPLWLPSQNGWLADLPQAHHQ